MSSGAIPERDSLAAARRERARRLIHSDLRGYPAVPDEDETEQTLAAAPPNQAEKKPKPGDEPGHSGVMR